MSEWGRCCILKSVYTAATPSPFDPDLAEEDSRFDAPGLPPGPHRRPRSSILWTAATARDVCNAICAAPSFTQRAALGPANGQPIPPGDRHAMPAFPNCFQSFRHSDKYSPDGLERAISMATLVRGTTRPQSIPRLRQPGFLSTRLVSPPLLSTCSGCFVVTIFSTKRFRGWFCRLDLQTVASSKAPTLTTPSNLAW